MLIRCGNYMLLLFQVDVRVRESLLCTICTNQLTRDGLDCRRVNARVHHLPEGY